jgi:hypothetical protein
MSEHWGSQNIEKDIEVTPGKTNSFDTREKRIYFSKVFFCIFMQLLFFGYIYSLPFISFSMKVLFVPAVEEKVWKETDDASKKEYRR